MDPKIRCSCGCLYIPKPFPKRKQPLQCPRCGKINPLEEESPKHKREVHASLVTEAELSDDILLPKDATEEELGLGYDFDDLDTSFKPDRFMEQDEEM